jgi:hypothetical protein
LPNGRPGMRDLTQRQIECEADDASAVYSNPILAILLAGSSFVIAFSALLVFRNYRPTLNWDQWGDLTFLININAGHFSLLDLFAQNNEHRIFTARLWFLVDAFLFDYQNAFLLVIIFISHLLLGGLTVFLWFDRTDRPMLRAAACIGGAAALVTIVQYDNLLWGFQIEFSQVYLFGLLALLALGKACLEVGPARRAAFLGLYIVLSALSAFSLANGVLLPVAAIMLIFFMRGSWTKIVVVALSGIALGAIYLTNYQIRGTDYLVVTHVVRYTCYLLAAPFVKNIGAAVLFGAFGAALLFLITVAGLWSVWRRNNVPLRPAVLTCLAGFTLASAVVTGIGRAAALGVEQAASGRYATVALLFWLSLAGAAYCFISQRFLFRRGVTVRNAIATGALVALVLVVGRLESDADSQRAMSEWASRIDRASMAIINNVAMTEGAGLDVLFIPPIIEQRAKLLRQYGWNIFSSRQKTYAPPIHRVLGVSDKPAQSCRGFVDTIMRLDAQRIALRGWLLPPTTVHSPSWIFVLDELGGVVGYFLAHDWRPDLVEKFGAAAGNGYFAAVDFKRPIAPGALKLSLVAVFEGDTERTCAFTGNVDVPGYEIASYYGTLPGRALGGLAGESNGSVVTRQKVPIGFPALPVSDPLLHAAGRPSPEGGAVTYRFDVSSLGADDLAIPVCADASYEFPIVIVGSNGPIESIKLNTLSYPVWKIWRLAIVPRARLPARGEIAVKVQIPEKAAPAAATLGPPFATPANPNRAALY